MNKREWIEKNKNEAETFYTEAKTKIELSSVEVKKAELSYTKALDDLKEGLLENKFASEEDARNMLLDEKEIEFIKHVVKTHMGKWNTNPYSDVVLEVPKDRYQYFVHMCDYLASRKFITVKFEGEEIE